MDCYLVLTGKDWMPHAQKIQLRQLEWGRQWMPFHLKITEAVNIDKEIKWKILHNLNMKKAWFKMFSWVLTIEQKEHSKEICTCILQGLGIKPNICLKNIITCGEIWIFQYDSATKWQLVHLESIITKNLKNSLKQAIIKSHVHYVF